MQTGRTTSATTLRLFVRALDALGLDSGEVLRLSEIDPAVLGDPEARIAQERYERVWENAQKISGDRCIGLHAGECVRPRAVNIFGYLLLSSETIGVGIRRVVRYQLAVTGTPFLALAEESDRVRVRNDLPDVPPEARAIYAEYASALALQWTSWVSETRIEPIETRFEHAARGDPAEYRRILHGPVRFEADANEVVFDRETLERPSVHANPEIAELHEEYAARLLGRHTGAATAARVQRALAEELESGRTELAHVARRLGMSTRSLQRKLADEQTSFREVLDRLRCELARDHLERHRTPLAEIAYLTGFSDVSAFSRAVRRWFGRPPSEMRGGDTAPAGALQAQPR